MPACQDFFPVPVGELTEEFGAGASPEEICARSIRTLRGVGVRNLYLSNLPLKRAAVTVENILALV